uniref:Evasin n=1 Tax=Rhipicephalus pulchellus TaxID=72859 RepID=L7M9R3_RHIPC
MVWLFFWVAFFPFAACELHVFHTVQAGGVRCEQHTLRTPVGLKYAGCLSLCDGPRPAGEDLSGKDCVTASPEAVPHMTFDVNYTCELGVCINNKCNPFDLLIGCWKPSTRPGNGPKATKIQISVQLQ